MLSSPPMRAHMRPTSPTVSDYSIDLNALHAFDSDGDTSTSIPKPRMDRVFSEDIEGPSDFTQNMEHWMNGGSLRRNKSANTAAQTQARTMDEQENDGEAPGHHEEEQEEYEQDGQEQEDEQSLQSLLHVPVERDEEHGGDGSASGSHHTPKNTPPRVSVLENDDQQFSSEWHTYGSASTPVPPVHKQFLQPTVEDHYSELSPARHSTQHTVRGRTTHSTYDMQRRASLQEEGSTPGRASSPTLSPVRSPLLQRRASVQVNKDDKAHDQLEMQLRELQAKCEQLEHLNSALKNALDDESRTRRKEKAEFDSQIMEAARRERDLAEMKEAAYQHNDDFRRQFGEMTEKLRATKEKLQEQEGLAASEAQDMESKHAAEMKRLRDSLARQDLEHQQEVRALEQDLELARRSTDNAEAASRTHKKDLDAQQEDHDVELERMQAELQNEREDEGAIMELERLLQVANEDIRRFTQASREVKEEMQLLRDQMIEVKQGHDEEMSRTTAERTRAVELAAGLQRQVQDLKTQLKEEQAHHGDEVQGLKAAQTRGSDTSTEELNILRRELDAKQNELNEAILERDEAVDDLEISKAEQQAKIEELETLNVELDAKVSETVRRREEVWRRKLEKSEEERKLMAKTLLHQWGREELGKESPQRYAYKYTSSPTKS